MPPASAAPSHRRRATFQYQSGHRAFHRLSQSFHRSDHGAGDAAADARLPRRLPGLAAEELSRAFRVLPFQQPRRRHRRLSRPPIRRVAPALDTLAELMNTLLVATREAICGNPPAQCRRARAARAAAAEAADRARRRPDQRHRSRSSNRDQRAAGGSRCYVRAGEHRTRRPRLSRPPVSSPSAPPSSATAACWSRGARAAPRSASGPCRAAWSRPAKR